MRKVTFIGSKKCQNEIKMLNFPYEENSLNGIFAKGIRKGLAINYSTSLYPALTGYPVSNCFDANPSTFCHTSSEHTNDSQYIQVCFFEALFKIEGIAIQNRADNNWDLQNYVVQGSKNGVSFKNITKFNEESSVCGGNKIRTRRVTTNTLFSCIRIVKDGFSCNSNNLVF